MVHAVLCKQLLTACHSHDDFTTAYDMLKISGYYYHLLFPDENDDLTHFGPYYIHTLRSRVIQHPIFEELALWRIAINGALSSYCLADTAKKRRKRTSLLSCLKPVIVHMCSANMSPDKIESLIQRLMTEHEVDTTQFASIGDYIQSVSSVMSLLSAGNGEVIGSSCEHQKKARSVLHGGVPSAKHPVSPWIDVLRLESPWRPSTNVKDVVPDTALSEPTHGTQLGPQATSHSYVNDRIQAILSAGDGLSDSCEDGADSDGEDSRKLGRQHSRRRDRSDLDEKTPLPIINALSRRDIEFTPAARIGTICNHDTYVSAVDISRTHLASGDSMGHVQIVDMDSGEKVMEYKHHSAVTVLQCMPYGLTASACASGVLKISRVSADVERSTSFGRSTLTKFGFGKPAISSHKSFATAITCLCHAVPHVPHAETHDGGPALNDVEGTSPSTPAFAADSDKWLVGVGGGGGGVKIYQGTVSNAYGSGGFEVMSMAAPDRGGISSMYLVSSEMNISSPGSASKYLPRRETGDDRKVSESFFSTPPRMSTLWSPMPTNSASITGSLLLGTTRGGIMVYDLRSKLSIFAPALEECHKSLVSCIVPVRKHELLTGGYDRVVKLWDMRSKYSTVDMVGSLGSIIGAVVDEYNDYKIIAACADNCIRFWDTRSSSRCTPYMILQGHSDRITSIIQKDGILVSGSYDGTVKSWNLSTGKCIQTLGSDTFRPVSCMALSAISTALDGKHLVSVNMDNEEDATSPPCLQNINLVCGGWEGSVRVWTGKEY